MTEIYDVVDEDDNIIGKATRKEVHTKHLIHRSIMFFIFDKKGRIFVNQRTKNKEFFKEYWSIALGGHINAGETYDEAVVREAKEEANIDDKPFFMGSFNLRIPNKSDNENARVYGFVTDKKLKLDPYEIKQGRFMTMEEMLEKIEKEKFLPETKDLFRILKNLKNKTIIKWHN
jgi:isopentenyldiphosphate isomerase